MAIGFLFWFLNAEHENLAGELVRDVMPNTYVCLSSEVVPEFREFERFSTTVINAFIGPKVDAYVSSLERRL